VTLLELKWLGYVPERLPGFFYAQSQVAGVV
jgi:hypothetical protein